MFEGFAWPSTGRSQFGGLPANAGSIRAASPDAIGSPAFASSFARTRRFDARAAIRATDLLATLYVRRDPLSSLLRGAALTALDLIPPARRAFARRMIYGTSAW